MGITGFEKYEIYDVFGKVAMEGSFNGSGIVEVNNLCSGTYFVRLFTDDISIKSQYTKFIKR